MRFDRRLFPLYLGVATLVVMGNASADTWRGYVNGRYGFSIEHPAQFVAGDEPADGDGRSFTAPDGAEFTVSGELNNPAGQRRTISRFETYLRSGGGDYSHVSYRAASSSSLVLSGLRGNKIFYEKYIFSQKDQLINSFEMTYPKSLKLTYDPIVARMARSFRPGKPLGNWK